MVGNSDINSQSFRAESSTESNGTQTVQVQKDLLEKSCRMLTPAKYKKESSLFPNKNGWGRPEERAKKYGVYRVSVLFVKCSVQATQASMGFFLRLREVEPPSVFGEDASVRSSFVRSGCGTRKIPGFFPAAA